MAKNKSISRTPRRIAFIGTYLPRRCGIGTFTRDLAEAVAADAPETEVWALGMNDRPEGYRYPHRVKFEVNAKRPADYRLAAEFLNTSSVDAVCLQHEYGIYGGEDGNRILEFVQRLRTPVVTTLHTVLRDPTQGQRDTLLELAEMSDRLIVLAERAVGFLKEIYGIPGSKIVHIPHGIPDVPFIDPNFYKDQFGVEGKKVILTFGLLGPNKGIETMIDAMPQVVKAHPEAVYIVLGATHPHVQATCGEDYRTTLQNRAVQHGIGEHVIFHNRFVDLKELCEFLGAADVYVTPYLSEAQIVSGSLAYALGAGNAVVSTPYWYAQELLAEGRGRLVPFQEPQGFSDAIIDLFDHEVERHAIRKRAYQFTRGFIWPQVARQYSEVFTKVTKDHKHSRHPATPIARVTATKPELPEVKLDHLRSLTDDTSIFQHAKGIVPNLEHGYTTDDTARALIATLIAREFVPSGSGCTALACQYLAFLNHAWNEKAGRFRNFMSYDRQWMEEVGSEDSHARAIWALGEAVARGELRGHTRVAQELFHAALPAVTSFKYPRPWAYTLIGIHAYLRRFGGDTDVKRLRADLSTRLMNLYEQNASTDWPWPEHLLVWGNARLPHALLLCGQWMFEPRMVDLALRSLDWLIEIQTAKEGHFSPVGCHGWFVKGQAKAKFDQQAIEAHATVDACLEAHRVTRDKKWIDRSFRIFNWFLGDNDLRIPVYDPTTGGCYDGLHAQGVNENQGAESVVCWLLSLLGLYEYGLTTLENGESSVEPGTVRLAIADQKIVAG